jgi:diguanylate cyclase (GGDEF)-like protein
MKSKSIGSKHAIPVKSSSLGRVLKQSEEIKETVEQVAGQLTSVNETLQLGKKDNAPVQTMKEAIALNEDVEQKVVKVANDLNQVNTQLVKEVAERAGMDADLADTKIELAEVREDLSKSQASEKEARKKSLQDPLTGLPNRALFEQALDHGLIQAKRHGWGLAVLFIDIDQFKSINDSYGHDIGDKVLLTVATRLQSFIRKEDTACRWGGDEFVCLLLEVKQEADVSRLAEKIVSRIAEACEFNGTFLSIIVSIGIALYPADGETADSLFKNADTAMYKAKRTMKRVGLFRESSLTNP